MEGCAKDFKKRFSTDEAEGCCCRGEAFVDNVACSCDYSVPTKASPCWGHDSQRIKRIKRMTVSSSYLLNLFKGLLLKS